MKTTEERAKEVCDKFPGMTRDGSIRVKEAVVLALKEQERDAGSRGMVLNEQQISEFDALARPLLKFLCENCHPHVSVILTPTNAELLEGCCSTGIIMDYVRD